MAATNRGVGVTVSQTVLRDPPYGIHRHEEREGFCRSRLEAEVRIEVGGRLVLGVDEQPNSPRCARHGGDFVDRLDEENLAEPLALTCSRDRKPPEPHRRDLSRQPLRPLRRNVTRQHLTQRHREEPENRLQRAVRVFDEHEGLRDPLGDVLTRRLA